MKVTNSINKILICFFCFSLILPGCGGKKEISSKKKVEIIFANESTTGEQREIIDKQLKKFASMYPDIKVKEVPLPAKSIQETLLVMFAGGSAPDIFFINRVDIPFYIGKGILLSLTPFIQKSEIVNIDDFYVQTLVPYRFDGKKMGKGDIYGFPKDFSPDFMMFYNKDLFDKAGIPYPSPGQSWDWNKFVEIAKKLTVRDKGGRVVQYGVSMGIAMYTLLVYSNGGKIFTDDYKKCLLDQPESLEAIRLASDLELKHKVSPTIQVTKEIDSSLFFRTGKVAMAFFGRWQIPNFYEELEFRWGVAPAPHIKKRINMMLGPNGYAIYKQTKHPEQTWKLMEFLVGPEHQRLMARLGWNIPSNKKAIFSKDFLENSDHPKGINEIFVNEIRNTISVPSNPYIGFWRMVTELERETDLYRLGKRDLETSLKKTTQKTNEIIQETIKRTSRW